MTDGQTDGQDPHESLLGWPHNNQVKHRLNNRNFGPESPLYFHINAVSSMPRLYWRSIEGTARVSHFRGLPPGPFVLPRNVKSLGWK